MESASTAKLPPEVGMFLPVHPTAHADTGPAGQPGDDAGRIPPVKRAKRSQKSTPTPMPAATVNATPDRGNAGASGAPCDRADEPPAEAPPGTQAGGDQSQSAGAPPVTERRIFVEENIRKYVNDHDMRLNGDTMDVLKQRVCAMLDAAVVRAQKNNRRTVKPQDV